MRLLFGKISLFDDEDRGEEGWREAEDNLDIFLEDTEPLFVRMSRFGNWLKTQNWKSLYQSSDVNLHEINL